MVEGDWEKKCEKEWRHDHDQMPRHDHAWTVPIRQKWRSVLWESHVSFKMEDIQQLAP